MSSLVVVRKLRPIRKWMINSHLLQILLLYESITLVFLHGCYLDVFGMVLKARVSCVNGEYYLGRY